jgi:hypothetical protein
MNDISHSLGAGPALSPALDTYDAQSVLYYRLANETTTGNKAAASRLAPHARRDASTRQASREFYRTMLEHHANAQSLLRVSRL